MPPCSSSCCLQAQWHHQGPEPLGRSWQEGDVVGCLLDAAERTMMLTLNGELQFSSRGSELAAKNFDIMDGENDVCCFMIIHLSNHCLLQFITQIQWHL